MLDTIEHNGASYKVEIVPDYDSDAPWDACDGHGPVSEWTTRAKAAGELVLCDDGHARRYYDYQEACKIARRDGWDAKPYNTGQETKAQQAAKAAMADFEYLRKWCEGYWHYVGVIVSAPCPCCGGDSGASASLWGIESNAYDYLEEVARELVHEVAS